ncbi:MAG: hypothetical protein JRH19_28835 [Deltaproteobacteria bacterium]|nr:hypothetical protein [Deltaproteobacteria bacterium]
MDACRWTLAVALLGMFHGAIAAEPEAKPAHATEKRRITVPFEWHRGHILLKVEVNGSVLRLTLDNGVLWDELLLYGGPRVDALKLKLDEPPPGAAEGELPPMASASGLTVGLPGLELRDQAAFITPASSRFAQLFEGEDGVIGGTLFSRFVVRIDFERSELTLVPPGGFEYQGKGKELALTPFGTGAYTMPVRLHMGDGEVFVANPVLDLGGLQPLLFFRGARGDLPLPDGASPETLAVGWDGHLGAVPEVRIGGFSLKDVPAGYTGAEGKLGPRCEGLLGPGIFARFHVTFDYSRERLFLEANRYIDAPFHARFRGWDGR